MNKNVIKVLLGISVVILVALLTYTIFFTFKMAQPVKNEESVSEQEIDFSLEQIRKKGYFTVGVNLIPPMTMLDEKTGEVVGVDIDIARAVFKEMGIKLKIKVINWEKKIDLLIDDKIDAIWGGFTITKDRDSILNFSKPYFVSSQQVMLPIEEDKKPRHDIDYLETKRIGILASSSIEKHIKSITTKKIKKYGTLPECLEALKRGEIDGIAGDTPFFKTCIRNEPGKYYIVNLHLSNEYYGIGFRQDDDALRIAVDRAFDKIYKNGDVQRILDKYSEHNLNIRRDIDKILNKNLLY